MSKTVLITGGSKGIGAACAILFALAGYNVVINFNYSHDSAVNLQKNITDNGYNAVIARADVRSREEVDRMVNAIIEKYGKIDVLINNAGIAQQKLFGDITTADWNNMIETNLTGVFNCTQSVLKHMIKEHSGNIVNISSVWGVTGGSCEVHYSAAKAGVIGLTKALAKEVAPSGIRVNCIAPGVIDTEMNSNLTIEDLENLCEETPLGRMGTPEEVAKAVMYLASDDSSFVTGQVLEVNGGINI